MSDRQNKETFFSQIFTELRRSITEPHLPKFISKAKLDITEELQKFDKPGKGYGILEKDEVEKAAPRIKEIFKDLVEKYPEQKNYLLGELSGANRETNTKSTRDNSDKTGSRTGIVFDREGFAAYMNALREIVPNNTPLEPGVQHTPANNTRDQNTKSI